MSADCRNCDDYKAIVRGLCATCFSAYETALLDVAEEVKARRDLWNHDQGAASPDYVQGSTDAYRAVLETIERKRKS